MAKLPRLTDFPPYIQQRLKDSEDEMIFIEYDDEDITDIDLQDLVALLSSYPDLQAYMEVDLHREGNDALVVIYSNLYNMIKE